MEDLLRSGVVDDTSVLSRGFPLDLYDQLFAQQSGREGPAYIDTKDGSYTTML
jgi:hypothetical protein